MVVLILVLTEIKKKSNNEHKRKTIEAILLKEAMLILSKETRLFKRLLQYWLLNRLIKYLSFIEIIRSSTIWNRVLYNIKGLVFYKKSGLEAIQ